MLGVESAASRMEAQQTEKMTDCVPSTVNDGCDVIDENVSEEENKRKKKSRRKKKSKIANSDSGTGNEVGSFSGERVTLGNQLYSELAYLSLNCEVPDEELEVYLNSNGTNAKVNNVDIHEQDQEDAANSLTPPKQKGSKKKKKKKKKEANAMQFSPSHSSNVQLGPDQQTNMHQIPNDEATAPRKEVNARDRRRRT